MHTAPVPASASRDRLLPLRQAQEALAAYVAQPADAACWQALVDSRRDAAEAIAELPGAQKTGPAIDAVRQLLKDLIASGAYDRTVESADVVRADGYTRQGWTGLFAAMVLVPAWQWPTAPGYDKVPSWLWADYTPYLFHPVQGFTAVGHADTFAAHYLRRLGELARLAAANRGSSAVRAAAVAYLKAANLIPLYFANESLRRHYELRERILAAAVGLARQEPMEAFPRAGRKLRVGFVNRHFGPQTETYAMLPMFEHLDPERFEVALFVHQTTDTVVEKHARSRVAEFHELPADLAAQVEILRSARLDVIVFGANVTADASPVVQLALHRMAPVQVVANAAGVTTGLPEIDLFVASTLSVGEESAAHFTERLALLPVPAVAFNHDADHAAATRTWSRAAMGIGDGDVVFVATTDYSRIGPEARQAWTRLLAAVPGSRLLVHATASGEAAEAHLNRFAAELDRAGMEQGGVNDRILLSTDCSLSRSDMKELLRVGDIYLDPAPLGEPEGLVHALSLGLAAVVLEGSVNRLRTSATLLRSIGQEEYVARDLDGYIGLATQLAVDSTRRAGVRARIQETMGRCPAFVDTLAMSDAFGALALRAYDEMAEADSASFRRATKPVVVGAVEIEPTLETARSLFDVGLSEDAREQVIAVLEADPVSSTARHLMARILEKQGKIERAADYLLAVLQRGDAPAIAWRELAGLLARMGRGAEAVHSLETALRLDSTDVEAWFMLGDIASRCGHAEIRAEVGAMVAELAPNDPRTVRLQAEAAPLMACS